MMQSRILKFPVAGRAVVRGFMVAALAAGGWVLSAGMSQAQARDVYWSVGVQSPGVQVGVSNAPPPVYVQRPRPVYVQPAPVVVYPGYRHVRPVLMAPAPVYYQESYAPVYIGPRDHRWERRDRRFAERHDHRRHRHGRDD